MKIAGAPSLLFLSHGSAPLVMNKLDYSEAGKYPEDMHWNQRPRDVANIARWIGRETERELNWQTVNLSASIVSCWGQYDKANKRVIWAVATGASNHRLVQHVRDDRHRCLRRHRR